MDQKELIITGIIIFIAVVAASIIFTPSISTSVQHTNLDVLNKGALGENSTVYVKLTDDHKNSLSNRTIHVKLTDDKNNVVYEDSVKTQSTGVAIVKLHNVSAGEYKLDVNFDGDENHTGCSVSQKVTVKAGEVKDELANSTLINQTLADANAQGASSSQSSSSSYSPSSSGSSSGGSSSGGSSSGGSSSGGSSSSSSDDGSSKHYDPDGQEVPPEYDPDGNIIN